MASQVMRITLKAYDHQLVDASAAKIIETVKKNGATVSGPVPLPTKKEVVTILRAVHKYKDSIVKQISSSYYLTTVRTKAHRGEERSLTIAHTIRQCLTEQNRNQVSHPHP